MVHVALALHMRVDLVRGLRRRVGRAQLHLPAGAVHIDLAIRGAVLMAIRIPGSRDRSNPGYWSNDAMQLARIALAVALRNELDVLELLPDAPTPSTPRKAQPVGLTVVT
jgi:hypothetical protein